MDLRANRRLSSLFDSASTPGNVVQIGQINGNISAGNGTTFTLALGFGGTREVAASDARALLAAGFAAVRAKYENGWHAYVAPLRVPNSVAGSPNLRTQYNVALMALKVHEDKTFPGAGIASISTPWERCQRGQLLRV